MMVMVIIIDYHYDIDIGHGYGNHDPLMWIKMLTRIIACHDHIDNGFHVYIDYHYYFKC